jgi:hypothetical protein
MSRGAAGSYSPRASARVCVLQKSNPALNGRLNRQALRSVRRVSMSPPLGAHENPLAARVPGLTPPGFMISPPSGASGTVVIDRPL